MKLIVDLRLIHNSGIGTYIKNVFPSILENFDKVEVLGDPILLKKFSWSNQVKIIPFRYKIYSLLEQFMYPIRIAKCDVFWTPHFNAPLLPIKAKKRIVTVHDVNHLSNPEYFSFTKRILAKVLYKNAVYRSHHIFTVSDFSKSEILKFFSINPNTIKVVYCGVAQNFAKQTSNDVKIELPQNYLLYVGNVKPHKNLITLLKAYSLLNEKIKQSYKLVILGKKEGFITEDRQVFKFIEENNLHKFIHFTGFIPDKAVPLVYKKASLFVFPSLYEGFGLPILEAMSSGVPVLSSNKASLPEVAGEAALYFDPTNPINLKEHMIRLLEDQALTNELVQKGFEQAKKFDWQKSIDKHVKVLKNLNGR